MQKGAIAVPTSSIQRGAPGTFVYVIKDDNTVTVRPVKTGAVDGELTAITDGLTAGEKVVADGADKLREGARVEPIDRSATARREGARTSATGAGERKKGGKGQREGAESDATPPPGAAPGAGAKGGTK